LDFSRIDLNIEFRNLREDNGEAYMKVYPFLAVMILCIVLVPATAYLLGEWYAYWGHALLAIVFGVLAVFVRIRYYWEED